MVKKVHGISPAIYYLVNIFCFFVIGFKLNNIIFKKPMNWELVVFLIIATAIIYLVNYIYHVNC